MYSLRYYFIIIIIFEELSYHIMYVYIMLYSWNKLYYYYFYYFYCKQWPISSATGYLMSPAPPNTSSQWQGVPRRLPGSGQPVCEGHKRRMFQIHRQACFYDVV